MEVRTEIDISGALAVCGTVLKKLSYATNNSLTRVAKECVDEGQKEIAADFTIRKKFILTRLKILKWSTLRSLTTTVGIDSKVTGSPLLLGFFEEGGAREPTHGGEIAEALTGSPVRKSFGRPILNALKYVNLQIQNGKGLRRTFVVPGVGIFERLRKGNDPDATVMIYKFAPSAPLKKHMDLIGVMTTVVAVRFNPIFVEEFHKEVIRQHKKK